jgi:hypothetical protein
MMNRFSHLASVVALLLFVPAVLQSQTPASPPAPDHWWKKSPYAAHDSLDRILFHAEGSLSVNNTSGNYEAQMVQSGAEIDMRKGYATGAFSIVYNKQRTESGGNVNSMSYFLLHTNFSWDFLSFLTGQVGVVWEKNEQRMLKNQYLPYVGIGTRWTISSVHQLNLYLAGGRAFPTYTLPISFFGMNEGPYNGMYISQYYQFGITQDLSLEESFDHLRNLNETKRYSTNMSVKLSFALSPYLKIVLNYTRSLSTEAGFVGAKEVDTGQSVGINLAI